MQSECFNSLPPPPHLFLNRQSLFLFFFIFLSPFSSSSSISSSSSVRFLPVRIIITKNSRFSHEHALRLSSNAATGTSRCLIFSRIVLKYSHLRSFALLERFISLERVRADSVARPAFHSHFSLLPPRPYHFSLSHLADDHSTRRSSPRILPKFLFPVREASGRSRGGKR